MKFDVKEFPVLVYSIVRTTIIPSCPELCTEAPNHCLDLSSIIVPEALLFPAKIELKVKISIRHISKGAFINEVDSKR